MDLRSFKLRLADRHVRAVFVSARGEEPADLEGDAFERVAEAARPLVDAVEKRAGGRPRALSIDAEKRAITVSLDGGGAARLAGEHWDALAEWIGLVARAIGVEARGRRPDRSGSPSEPEFWARVYRERSDGWELARAAPPLARWFAEHPPVGRRALVAGCGRGHEARLLAHAGARVIAIDFAEEAIAEARALAAQESFPDGALEFRRRDLFALAADPERYSLAVEHCCFCAIDPARRGEYARTLADVLEPGGELIALFWSHGRPGGPPFTVDAPGLRALFEPLFHFSHVETPPDSVALRLGQELLVQLVRR
jgi:SAM-dependent methyltransferase